MWRKWKPSAPRQSGSQQQPEEKNDQPEDGLRYPGELVPRSCRDQAAREEPRQVGIQAFHRRLRDGRDSGDQKAGVEVQQRARTGIQIRAITKQALAVAELVDARADGHLVARHHLQAERS